MTPDELPALARALIDRHIHSVEQLEVLLLLRAAPDKDWTPAEVARTLVSRPDTAEQRLVDLANRGLLRANASNFRYAPDGETDIAVRQLAAAYATRRTRVIARIFSKPEDAAPGVREAFRISEDS
ncbi:MAG TPA: hypothetical protein VH300_15445 [Thermoleophilaceae bacterium]|nr:hypothetical protein [Thermoleophilaceae bacterium]